MKKYIRPRLIQIYIILKIFGFDPLKFMNSLRGLRVYYKDLSKIKRQKGNDTKFYFGHKIPILFERFDEAGSMSGAYFHQDLLVAKKIFINNPTRHIDIGSRTDGFVAHVAVFREIEIFDIRFQKNVVENIVFKQADLMNLNPELIDYCDSISSLHAIEHFGLGRYGDPIDYDGHKKAIENIHKILKTNGKFYFSTPIGPQRIEFNAHRVFDVQYLVGLFKMKFTIENFSYVNDRGSLFNNIDLSTEEAKSNFNCKFGCGIFELKKI